MIDITQGLPSPTGDQPLAIIRAIDLFTEQLPELIAIGALLERSFPAAKVNERTKGDAVKVDIYE
ncbi:MAG: hypothetical protein ACO29W_20145 [Burkholderiaceae bacterium]